MNNLLDNDDDDLVVIVGLLLSTIPKDPFCLNEPIGFTVFDTNACPHPMHNKVAKTNRSVGWVMMKLGTTYS